MEKLNGRELAGFVKERQAAEVRRLKGAGIMPKLVIISEGQNKVNEVYTKIKKGYGKDIGVDVELASTKNAADSKKTTLRLNDEESTHGIVIQLPLTEPDTTDSVVNLIEPAKDVDGLGKDAVYEPATATAILWLLASYGVELRGKGVVVAGYGKLVGQPLVRILESMEIEPVVLDETSQDFKKAVKKADILITATGQPGLITSDILKSGAVVIDAGTASEEGLIKGDVAEDAYERDDITITPKKGGIGPLTVAVLFDNVLRAARARVGL